MRRVVTFLTAIVLLLGSLGVGVFTADLPFWQRAFQLPLPPDGAYLPVAVIGNSAAAPMAAVPAAESAFEPAAVEAVAAQARGELAAGNHAGGLTVPRGRRPSRAGNRRARGTA